MYGSQLDEDRLISLKTFKSKVVPTGRRADDENVHSIVAVVSQSANLREVKTKKRAKPFYYVDFEVEDDSSNEALCVKLWGEVERFDQLKHELVQGVTIVLQSVVLHADFYRGNRLTIQEHRYGYSSCIYIVRGKSGNEQLSISIEAMTISRNTFILRPIYHSGAEFRDWTMEELVHIPVLEPSGSRLRMRSHLTADLAPLNEQCSRSTQLKH